SNSSKQNLTDGYKQSKPKPGRTATTPHSSTDKARTRTNRNHDETLPPQNLQTQTQIRARRHRPLRRIPVRRLLRTSHTQRHPPRMAPRRIPRRIPRATNRNRRTPTRKGPEMSAQRYFPNGNPDYETPWTRERNTGWIILATAITGTLIHHYWLEYDFILATAFSFYGLSIGLIHLGTQGRDQAETLQETEGQLDWAIKKLRSENLPIGPYDENQ